MKNDNEKIGFVGLILVISGLFGAIAGGIILDRTKAFRLITFLAYAFSFLAMILFTATLHINIWIIFGTSFLLGFFMTGYLPVGFELAAEITYPESEGTSCGLLTTTAPVCQVCLFRLQEPEIKPLSCLFVFLFIIRYSESYSFTARVELRPTLALCMETFSCVLFCLLALS